MYGSIKLTVTVTTPDGVSDDIVLSQPTLDEEDHAIKYQIMAASVGGAFPKALEEVLTKTKGRGRK